MTIFCITMVIFRTNNSFISNKGWREGVRECVTKIVHLPTYKNKQTENTSENRKIGYL